MTKPTSRIIVSVTLAAVVVGLSGCCSVCKLCNDRVIIITQPKSQTVLQGTNATFSVSAVKEGPPWTPLTYQWQVNTTILFGNLHWTNLVGATNATLMITNVQLANVGLYRVRVSGGCKVTSANAQLYMISTSGGAITVYGTPVASIRSGSVCPYPYKGYANYDNGGVGYAVVDRNSSASAANTDPGAPPHHDASIRYGGYEAFDSDCALNNITIPANSTAPQPPGSATAPATASAHYWFTLYFKKTPLPTGPYGLILNKF